MTKDCNSCTSCNMHGGSVSVITPAAYPQGEGWSEPNNLPGSNGRNVSEVGNHFSLNSDAGALPDPQSGGACGCEKPAIPVGGKKRRRASSKKKGRKTRRKTKGRKGKKGKKSRRKTKGRKGRKTARKGRKSRVRRRKNRRTKRRPMRGGMSLFDDRGRLFQPATNVFRNTLFGAGEMVNQWQGKPAPLNPAPTSQERLTPMGDVTLPNIPDVPGIHRAAGQAVANI